MRKLIGFLIMLMIISAQMSYSADFIVTNRNETGYGSLRYAIEAAGSASGAAHNIRFNIPAGSPYIIKVPVELSISTGKTIIIDATTQPGYVGKPLVQLIGTGSYDCFRIYNSTVTVKGFIIGNFNVGLKIDGNSAVTILGNFIGNNGVSTEGFKIKKQGVLVGQSNFKVVIGGVNVQDRNVISGCLNHEERSSGNQGAIEFSGNRYAHSEIVNNFIGTDSTGRKMLGNGIFPLYHHGVFLKNAGDITIASNVISGNKGYGIYADLSSVVNIKGNKVGTDLNGSMIIPDLAGGISLLNCGKFLIGGKLTGERNIISGNGGAPDSRPCGAVWCEYPCGSGCPDKIDATLQVGILCNSVYNSIIEGNLIGTDSSGISSGSDHEFGNRYAGIKIQGKSNGIVVGGDSTSGNVICSNGYEKDPAFLYTEKEYYGSGLYLYGIDVFSCTVKGNYIGIGSDGKTILGNRLDGITLAGVNNNEISSNVISGNTWGIFIQDDFTLAGQASGNIITGNKIGTDATGKIGAGNGLDPSASDGAGICIESGSRNNIIGNASLPGNRNIISGNRNGIVIRNSSNLSPLNNLISANYIGLDITGSKAIPNKFDGIKIECFKGNIVGLPSAAGGNYICGNGRYGIDIAGASNLNIQNNDIGVDVNGLSLPNNSDGIYIHSMADTNLIGGLKAGEGNRIGNNKGNGIKVAASSGNKNLFQLNSIFCNEGRGIVMEDGYPYFVSAPVISFSGNLITVDKPGSFIELYEKDDCQTCGSEVLNNKIQGKGLADSGVSPLVFTLPAGKSINDYTATAWSLPEAFRATSEFTSCAEVISGITGFNQSISGRVFPNPFQDNFSVDATQGEDELSVISVNGNLIGTYPLNPGINNFGGELQSGLYIIKIKSGNQNNFVKINKL
jgi:parallel beta-helix repeat protein